MTTLVNALRSLDEELNEWKDASEEVSNSVQEVISGIENSKNGEMSPNLRNNIQGSISAFEKLKSKIDEVDNGLSNIISVLSSAESSTRFASGTLGIGKYIFRFCRLDRRP